MSLYRVSRYKVSDTMSKVTLHITIHPCVCLYTYIGIVIYIYISG